MLPCPGRISGLAAILVFDDRSRNSPDKLACDMKNLPEIALWRDFCTQESRVYGQRGKCAGLYEL